MSGDKYLLEKALASNKVMKSQLREMQKAKEADAKTILMGSEAIERNVAELKIANTRNEELGGDLDKAISRVEELEE